MLAQGADCEPLPVAVVLSLRGGGGWEWPVACLELSPGVQVGRTDRGDAREVPLGQVSAQQRRTC